MIEVFHDMWPHDIEIFFDDLCIMDMHWDDHFRKLSEVCRRLEDNGFTVNPLKCQWGVQETDFLGFWLTPNGYKPWAKKIEPFLSLSEPTTLKQLHRLFPLTKTPSRVPHQQDDLVATADINVIVRFAIH